MITLQPINENNFMQAVSLKVHPEQRTYVQSASMILARAYAYRDQRGCVWALYEDHELVGLAMMHDLEEEPACYHLCQFMIDASQQGKGYGQQTLRLILEKCRRERKFPRVEVCVKKENTAAIHVYEKAGFRDTGYIDPATPDCISVVYEFSSEILYRDIVLRDMKESDIEDEIRWNTVETGWALWDAPWEMEVELLKFDPKAYRQSELKNLKSPKDEPRWGFELDTAEGIHIGSVNSYLIDENWEWIAFKEVKAGQKVYRTLGIEINDSHFWGRGLGTQALAAFAKHFIDNGISELCLQTWSGNIRMIRVAEKVGFVECNRNVGNRLVRGGAYDGLTFKLDLDRFHNYLQENA